MQIISKIFVINWVSITSVDNLQYYDQKIEDQVSCLHFLCSLNIEWFVKNVNLILAFLQCQWLGICLRPKTKNEQEKLLSH